MEFIGGGGQPLGGGPDGGGPLGGGPEGGGPQGPCGLALCKEVSISKETRQGLESNLDAPPAHSRRAAQRVVGVESSG